MRSTRLASLAVACAAAIALMAALAPSAGARATVTPPTQDFGAFPLGVNGGTLSYTLTVACNAGMGCAPDPLQTEIAITNPDFSIVNEDCPDLMPGVTMAGTSCSITVGFTPVAAGIRGGFLTTGTYATPVPPPAFTEPGPTAEAFGHGLCFTCFSGADTGAQPAYVAPIPGTKPNVHASSDSKKKCKKKKGAAKKKCKKKRK